MDRFALLTVSGETTDLATDVRNGLTSQPKVLSPKWFYDDAGSALFEAICRLPEYYVSRAEEEILAAHAGDIARAMGRVTRLVELGSGTSRKTRLLIDAIGTAGLEYVPLDGDAGVLRQSGRALVAAYPLLRVTAICADFSHPSVALLPLTRAARTAVIFLGSSIGNLDFEAAAALLRDVRNHLRPGEPFLVGFDLRKPREVLEPAYADAGGVTAAFNRNVLMRINRELGGSFDPEAFAHRAVYDETAGRVEMHLVSTRAQEVSIESLGLRVRFEEGESIHTESSYKYDESTVRDLAAAGGFTVENWWIDRESRFADVLLIAG